MRKVLFGRLLFDGVDGSSAEGCLKLLTTMNVRFLWFGRLTPRFSEPMYIAANSVRATSSWHAAASVEPSSCTASPLPHANSNMSEWCLSFDSDPYD